MRSRSPGVGNSLVPLLVSIWFAASASLDALGVRFELLHLALVAGGPNLLEDF
jgi:hypothetical protein